MAAKLLTQKQIDKFCTSQADWRALASGKKLQSTFNFDSHIEALTFVMRVTIHAQVQQHHPDITFTYAKVKIALTTHDAGGVTRKDLRLAKDISDLYQQ